SSVLAWICLLLLQAAFVSVPALRAQARPPSPVFYKTQNSDEWVVHTLRVQKKYSRVLVVDASEHPPKRIRVSALTLNSRRSDNDSPAREYKVAAVFKTLQEAADAAKGGDLVAVMPGNYAGFVLEEKPSAADKRYIHFKAMGEPGDVVLDRPSRNPDWTILIRAAHHVIIQGFNVAGDNGPGI